jgi:hypothetical protein
LHVPLPPPVRQSLSSLQPQIPAGVSTPHTIPFCAVQLLPHEPQWMSSLVTSSSQPLSVPLAGMLQLAKPASQ